MTHVVAARIGRGLRDLPAIRGFSGSTTLHWLPGQDYPDTFEHMASANKIDRISLTSVSDEWPNFRVLQILQADADIRPGDDKRESGSQQAENSDRLSTISEEPTQDDSIESLAEYFAHGDPEMQKILKDTVGDFSNVLEPCVGSQPAEDTGVTIQLHHHD